MCRQAHKHRDRPIYDYWPIYDLVTHTGTTRMHKQTYRQSRETSVCVDKHRQTDWPLYEHKDSLMDRSTGSVTGIQVQ